METTISSNLTQGSSTYHQVFKNSFKSTSASNDYLPNVIEYFSATQQTLDWNHVDTDNQTLIQSGDYISIKTIISGTQGQNVSTSLNLFNYQKTVTFIAGNSNYSYTGAIQSDNPAFGSTGGGLSRQPFLLL